MLDEIQEKICQLGHLDIFMEKEKSAKLNLENVVKLEEIFQEEKSRVKWNCDGDKNTTYLHLIKGIKNASNIISSIRIGDNLISDPDEVACFVV